MTQASYHQFCPVAMAAELLCCRWTLLLVRELMLGSHRFNDLRRGVPRMSSALLAKRLKALEMAGLVARTPGAEGHATYRLTAPGRALQPIVEAMGVWAKHWLSAEASLEHLDADLLLWDIHRRIRPEHLPAAPRTTVQFILRDQPAASRHYWLLIELGAADVCTIDPGFDVDLYVTTDLRTLTAIWLGHERSSQARRRGALTLTGNRQLAAGFDAWIGLSAFAAIAAQSAAAVC